MGWFQPPIPLWHTSDILISVVFPGVCQGEGGLSLPDGVVSAPRLPPAYTWKSYVNEWHDIRRKNIRRIIVNRGKNNIFKLIPKKIRVNAIFNIDGLRFKIYSPRSTGLLPGFKRLVKN